MIDDLAWGMDNERAHAGRDGRTCLARPQFLRCKQGQGKFHLPCSTKYKQDVRLTISKIIGSHTYPVYESDG